MQKISLYVIGVAAAVLLGPVEPSFSQECPQECEGVCPQSEPEGQSQDVACRISINDPMGISGDGMPYDDSRRDKVQATVGRNANIRLVLGDASGRQLFVDLGAALGCACSVGVDVDPTDDACDDNTTCEDSVPFSSELVSGVDFIISLGQDLDDLALGCTHEDNAQLAFSHEVDTWNLFWGPYEKNGPFEPPRGINPCPGADPVVVTRTGDNTWSFESTGEHLACLYRQGENGLEYHGQFVVPFSGTATALDMDQTANLTACILQPCRDRRGRLAVPTSCDVIGPCGTCGDGNCDPGEDECNCSDDCAGVPAPPEGDCADGIDNDCDGAIDCADTDCLTDADEDGFNAATCGTDCDDTDASVNPVATENCADGIDNDCDGDTDCDDTDCTRDPACDCAQKNDPCSSRADCCSGVCKRNGTCR